VFRRPTTFIGRKHSISGGKAGAVAGQRDALGGGGVAGGERGLVFGEALGSVECSYGGVEGAFTGPVPSVPQPKTSSRWYRAADLSTRELGLSIFSRA
jgi:hypothetical protein